MARIGPRPVGRTAFLGLRLRVYPDDDDAEGSSRVSRAALDRTALGLAVFTSGDGNLGYPSGGLYDAIIVTDMLTGLFCTKKAARHASASAAADYLYGHGVRRGTAAETMRQWYTARDLLGVANETVIPESAASTTPYSTILHTSGLTRTAALTPCPARCARRAQQTAEIHRPATS